MTFVVSIRKFDGHVTFNVLCMTVRWSELIFLAVYSLVVSAGSAIWQHKPAFGPDVRGEESVGQQIVREPSQLL